MRKSITILFIILSACVRLAAQKIPLDNTVYDSWKSLGSPAISEDGSWITFTINPQQGDGWLYLYDTASGRTDSVARGTKAVFSPGSRYLAYQVIPAWAETRQAKKKKLKEDKMPKNSLGIRILPSGETTTVAGVKSFAVSESGNDWMAYLLEKSAEKKEAVNATDSSATKKEDSSSKKTKKPEPKGSELVIFNPLTGKEFRFRDVTEYVAAREGKSISFIQSIPDTGKIENVTISIFSTREEKTSTVFGKQGSAGKLSCDRTGEMISFLYSSDTSKVKVYSLWLSGKSAEAKEVVGTDNPSLFKGWSASENGSISFSDDGTRLFFGTAPKPAEEPKDTLLDDEKYRLDIWSWDDDVLQPMQKKQLDEERKRTYQAVYHIDRKVVLQLADTVIQSVRTSGKGNADIALGSSGLKYRKSSSWDGGGYSDYYYINVETGTKTEALEHVSGRCSLSPSGKFLLWWDNAGQCWFSSNVSGGAPVNVTKSIPYPLYDELNDVPDDPAPYGFGGWMKDEKHALIYDRFDIWLVDLEGKENPVVLTNGFGRKNDLRLRYVKLDPDAEFIDKKDVMMLSAFNYISKQSGFFSLNASKLSDPQKLALDKVSYPGDPSKAKKADRIIWQKGSFTSSPELYVSNLDFNETRKISTTNPQQSKYIWGSAELYEWTAFDRQKLQGILYKPENFDPSRKYPMIVYFYERSSDGLYGYVPPAPSPSRINITFAVSNGYIVFVPDIPYKIGYPGESCYNAVVSGTVSLLDDFDFIDRNRLGLDGQSWGGYQIAYLVTRTDLFACAYAGAAVSNMTSAYGGIRWGTGMSRMFQYEKTQSRIGGTLWEKHLQFIDNSPIFFVPKINTPLLLMHNDADDAVPWYQGIEFITALRRLGKPAWLLVYNDEAHNLVKRPNRKDISIRKMQFFDHYLKGADMPYWMKNGISQEQKGKIDGYNLVNE